MPGAPPASDDARALRCHDRWMVCRDGVRLATRLWMPPGTGPWPVLLMRQPYGRAIASTVTYAHPRWYAAHGFVVVVQDVRGRGDSEGSFTGFAQEAADGAEAVRWCRRLPESNGRVGTYGFSYQGLSQLLIAPGAPGPQGQPDPDGDPLPDCLAAAMCGVDERLHWASEGGAHWWSLGLGWALQLAAQGCRRRGDHDGWRAIRRSLESGAYLEEGPGLLERHDADGMGLQWLRLDAARADGWRRHAVSEALLRRPLLLIGGWHDPHLSGVLALQAQSRRAGGNPDLVVGAWSHLDWDGGLDHRQLAFFRRHLAGPLRGGAAGEDTGRPSKADEGNGADLADGVGSSLPLGSPGGTGPRLALQLPDDGGWWHRADLDRRCRLGWSLRSSGLAAIRSDEGELVPCPQAQASRPDVPIDADDAAPMAGLTLVHDPWRPVPSRGGHLGTPAGIVERSDLDRRGDVACFQTAQLQEPLPLLGRPRLRLLVGADQPGFDLCVCLSRVRPTGEVLQLCTGIRRLRGPRALQSDWRLVALQPLAARLQPGERLRLSLAAAAWPAFAVNPGDGSIPWGGSGPQHRVISLDLDLDGAHLWFLPLIGAN